jgi:ATP-dependent exoDNAse (exonuclease V) alpha subunit
MIKEHDRVVLLKNVPDEGLRAGDVGTVVHIYRQGEAFEVEFMTLDGRTVAIVTLPASHVRAISNRDVTHVRELVTS